MNGTLQTGLPGCLSWCCWRSATMPPAPAFALSEFQGALPLPAKQNAAPGDEAKSPRQKNGPPSKFRCQTLSSTGRPSSRRTMRSPRLTLWSLSRC